MVVGAMTDNVDVVVGPPLGATVEIEELQTLIGEAHDRGTVSAGALSTAVEEAELSAQQTGELMSYLEEHGIEVLSPGEGPLDLAVAGEDQGASASEQPATDAVDGEQELGERNGEHEHPEQLTAVQVRLQELRRRDVDLDDRAEPRLAASVPACDRPCTAAQRRRGGGAGQADRARRHDRQAAHGGGQPAPGGVDRQGLRRARPDAARPDPGGIARPDQGGGEVRLPPRLQVLDLRHLVDPPGGHPLACRQGPHDPHPGAHG